MPCKTLLLIVLLQFNTICPIDTILNQFRNHISIRYMKLQLADPDILKQKKKTLDQTAQNWTRNRKTISIHLIY